MANKKVLIWVSALATLAICGLCAIAIALGESEPTAELSQAAATVTITEAATATATEAPQPSPTVTLTPESPTVTPTEAPLPTGTATVAPTETVNVFTVYFFQVVPYTVSMGDALGDLSDLMLSPDFDEAWITKMALAIVVIRTSHEKLLEIVPPVEVSRIHEALLDATQDCNDMTYHLVTSIDNVDEQELKKANKLMESCGEKTKKATRMIEEFAGQ